MIESIKCLQDSLQSATCSCQIHSVPLDCFCQRTYHALLLPAHIPCFASANRHTMFCQQTHTMLCFCLQVYHAMSADIPCSASRHTMFCQQTYHVLPADIPCPVSRHIMLCQQTYHVLPADISALPADISFSANKHTMFCVYLHTIPCSAIRYTMLCFCQQTYHAK